MGFRKASKDLDTYRRSARYTPIIREPFRSLSQAAGGTRSARCRARVVQCNSKKVARSLAVKIDAVRSNSRLQLQRVGGFDLATTGRDQRV
jgi:hypothetical protein